MTNLFKGIFIGVTMAMPVGPLAVLCIRRSLHGYTEGLATALGVALADGFYALIVSLGVGAMGSFVLARKEFIYVGCGVFLLFLGIKALKNPPALDHEKLQRSGFGKVLIQTMLVTLTNAMTLVTFIAAFAAFGFEGKQPVSQAFLISLGVFLGSFLWFGLLSIAVSFLRRRVTPYLFKMLNIVAGSLFIGFGLLFIARGFNDLIVKSIYL